MMNRVDLPMVRLATKNCKQNIKLPSHDFRFILDAEVYIGG